jgi:hypothetical protein
MSIILKKRFKISLTLVNLINVNEKSIVFIQTSKVICCTIHIVTEQSITKGHFIHGMGLAEALIRLSPQSGPTLWTFLGPNLVTCKVVRPDSRARWSWGLNFIELTVVNARCSRQLSFTTLNTMGDDIYRVVVSESKLGPTRLCIYFGVKMLL